MKTLRFEGYSDDTFGEMAVTQVPFAQPTRPCFTYRLPSGGIFPAQQQEGACRRIGPAPFLTVSTPATPRSAAGPSTGAWRVDRMTKNRRGAGQHDGKADVS